MHCDQEEICLVLRLRLSLGRTAARALVTSLVHCSLIDDISLQV